jgi:ParB family chromosome partitioning protein
MLSVANLPTALLNAMGGARNVGRDRWYELKQLLEKPATLEKALAFVEEADLAPLDSDGRFNALMAHLKTQKKSTKAKPAARNWAPSDRAVSVDIKSDGRNYTLALKARDAVGFGEFISANLDALYDDFRQSRKP